MDISKIYIHGGRLLKVIEDAESATVMMECELPATEWSDDLAYCRQSNTPALAVAEPES